MISPNSTLLWLSAAGGLLCAAVTAVSLPPFIKSLRTSNQLKRNYRGQQVPFPAGVLLVFVFAIACLIAAAMIAELTQQAGAILLLTFGMAVVGLFDDMAGSRDAGGFKGHLRKLVREGTLTTGLLKAIFGFMFALGVVVWEQTGKLEPTIIDAARMLLHGLIIALTANWINLLDVRPGRALKGSVVIILLLLLPVQGLLAVPLFMLGGIVSAYFPFDIKGKAMLGDTGANFIGAALGYITVHSLPAWWLLGVLAALLCLHVYTERYSLSRLIERNGILSWIDGLGQEEAH